MKAGSDAPATAAGTVAAAPLLSAFLLLAAAITLLYWALWFLLPGGRAMLAVLPDDASYIAFENAFPVADTWLALSCSVAAVRLWQQTPSSLPWLYMAGSAALYLGAMDILYDVENGIYARIAAPSQRAAVATEMLINAGTLLLSIWTLCWAHRHRRCYAQSLFQPSTAI